MPETTSTTSYEPVAPAWHTGLYLVYRVIATWLLYRSMLGGQSSATHSPLRLFSMLILANLLMLGYLAWGLSKRQRSLLDLVGGQWNSFRDVWKDCATAFVFWIASLFLIAGFRAVLPAPSGGPTLAFLTPHTRVELGLWFLVAVSAGITEELVYRGYLQKQFEAWTKNVALAMILSAILFGFGHLYQGGKRAITMGAYGWLLGWLAQQKKSLRPGMLAHTWQDCFGGVMLFLGRGR